MQSGTFIKCTNCVYNLNLAVRMSVQVISWLYADIPTIQPGIFHNILPEIYQRTFQLEIQVKIVISFFLLLD